MEQPKEIVGNHIRTKRKPIQLTQKHVADCAEITRQHLSRIERGKANCGLEVLIKLCKVVGIQKLNIL